MKIKIDILYKSQSGSFHAEIDPAIGDKTVRRICLEAVQAGNVSGIDADIPKRAFRKYVVERFHGEEVSFKIRSKGAFGSKSAPPFYCPFLHDRYFKTSKQRESWPENVEQIRDDLHYHL